MNNHITPLTNITKALPTHHQASISEKLPRDTPRDTLQIQENNRDKNPSGKNIQASLLPQDPMVGKPVTVEIEKGKINSSLASPRIRMVDNQHPTALPDPEGNYLFGVDSPQFNQVNACITAVKTFDMMESFLNRKIPWAFEDEQLKILPHARTGANAYYARNEGAVNLMYFNSKALGKTIYAAQSADIISHETAHAILDGLRPNFISSWNPETAAFHEAFADSTAMLKAMEHDNILQPHTGNSLARSNNISMLAEEFGQAINLLDKNPDNDNNTYIRNAVNSYMYSSPLHLPILGPEDTLTSEAHSFCRVFDGAFYDTIRLVAETKQKSNGNNLNKALKETGKELGTALAKAVDMSPPSDVTFKTIALNMIKADQQLNGGKNKKHIEEAFARRYIITRNDILQSEQKIDELRNIKLHQDVSSENDALTLLEKYQRKLDINPKEYHSPIITKDKEGYTFIQYTSQKEIPLNPLDYRRLHRSGEEIHTDILGGITLAFDPEGNLISFEEDRITPEKINHTLREISGAIDRDLVRLTTEGTSPDLFRTDGKPYRAEVTYDTEGKAKIRKLPVIID